MSAIFFWGSLTVMMACVGAIAYAFVMLTKDWRYYNSETRMDAVVLALKGISGFGFMGIVSLIVLFVSWLFYQPGRGQIFTGLAVGGGIAAVFFILNWRKSKLIGTQEILQEERVIERLQEMGYEPGIYVYGMFMGSRPHILNFTDDGIDFLELNSTCSRYTLHSYIDIETIADISLRKGTLINTLTILSENGMKQQFTISNMTTGINWQKENVIKMHEFLHKYFPDQ